MRLFALLAISATTVMFLTGCTDTPSGSGSIDPALPVHPSTAPDIAAPVSPAPTQPNRGNRPAVEFDPCAGVGDTLISEANFDPDTRERSDMVFDTYAFIGCRFEDKQIVRGRSLPVRTLLVTSSNITLDEFRKEYVDTSTELMIGGRAALRYNNPEIHRESCTIAIESPDGVLDIAKETRSAYIDEGWCDHIEEIAETIASALPENR